MNMMSFRKASFLERLERRALLSTVVYGTDGSKLGHTEIYTPAGGVHVATDREMRARSASGDGAPGFQISVVFESGLTASQQAAFTAAAARWETILLGDVPDVGSIDDVQIFARGEPIDGVGNILGSAGPTGVRNAANKYVPYQGAMRFDTADLAALEADGSLNSVIAHEMGHVLGVGTTWAMNNVRTGAGTSNPLFTGAYAVAEFSKMQGTLTQTQVPLENTGGSGTRDSHWRETTFASELMTGFISGTTQPLSRLTAASMIDIGYPLVDLEAAELFTRPTNPLPTIGVLSGPVEVPLNTNITLTLSAATDVSSIQFFRESNGFAGLQATGNITPDTLSATISSGLSASISTAGLPAGTYTFYAVVKDAFNLQSAYRSVTVSVVESVSTPSKPELAAASDLGSSSTDGLTSDNTPTFTGYGPSNQVIQLFEGATMLASTLADAAGNWTVTLPVLADGTHVIYARATDGVTLTSPSPSTTITIDTVAPVIQSALYDRDSSQDVTLIFGEAFATQVTAGKLTLTNTTTASTVPIASVTYSGGNTTARISFTPALLADGRYVLSMAASGVTDAAGNSLASNLAVPFVQLAGDANGDGTVNFSDLLIVAQNYNQNLRTFSQGNFNYDSSGIVDFSDLLLLAQNYGVSLLSVAPIESQATSTKRRSGATGELSAIV